MAGAAPTAAAGVAAAAAAASAAAAAAAAISRRVYLEEGELDVEEEGEIIESDAPAVGKA